MCEKCHTAYGNYREHLMRHYLWARGEVDKLGGMPEKPPLPRLLRRPKFKLPPVLSEAQTTASLQRYVREIEAKAKKLVGDHTNPKWNVTQNCSPVPQLQLRTPSAKGYETTFIRKTIKN